MSKLIKSVVLTKINFDIFYIRVGMKNRLNKMEHKTRLE